MIPLRSSTWSYDTNEAGDESGLDCQDPSLTVQSFKEEVDLNTLLKRFGIGYELPENHRMPNYGDFDTITSFHDAMNAVTAATTEFQKLPAHIRAEFDNSPAKFHDAALYEENRARFEALGLSIAKKPPQEAPQAPSTAATPQ